MNARLTDRERFAGFLMRMRAKGITDAALLDAFEATPRRGFVPAAFANAAYSDRTVPIECGEVIEGLDLQATVLSALGLDPSHRVLEIGTGSGFTAAVMAHLAARVTTADRYKTLCEQAKTRFEALRIANVIVRHADAKAGLNGEGPFDRIVAWAAFDAMPRAFVDQLATGGVMICPIGPAEGEQVLVRLAKVGSRFERDDLMNVRFQPIAEALAAAL
ncbi:MAG: protein-L-isoaspartate(D-aspartate) O-methyltransferase [Rhizobiaceae bacterium]